MAHRRECGQACLTDEHEPARASAPGVRPAPTCAQRWPTAACRPAAGRAAGANGDPPRPGGLRRVVHRGPGGRAAAGGARRLRVPRLDRGADRWAPADAVHRPGQRAGHAVDPRHGPGPRRADRPGPLGSIEQWVQLPDGRWISEKDPGYPFLAAPFQLLGIIRLAPLFYGALGCLGLFFGARRWLGRYGGSIAAGLFCSSGAALLFAWRDYMPTFTDASLIAAGTGALLWALLADEAAARRRTWIGLLGFLAIEAAVFARYTNIVVLGCAILAVLAVRWRRPVSVPPRALAWWLGSAVLFAAGVAIFDDLVYGGPFKSGYRAGEISFGLGAVGPNLRYLPAHLIKAVPMLVLGLAALAWIATRWVMLRRAGGEGASGASPDLAVGAALAASRFSVWGLYATYTWTAEPGLSTLQAVRFYLPAIGAISLLGAWLVVRLVTRLPGRASLAAVTSAAVVTAMFALGIWSFTGTNPFGLGAPGPVG